MCNYKFIITLLPRILPSTETEREREEERKKAKEKDREQII